MIIKIMLAAATTLIGLMIGQDTIKRRIKNTIELLDENEMTDEEFRTFITNKYGK